MYDLGFQFHKNISNLKSKPEAIIQGKYYRFTVLTERLIRLEYSIDSKFNDMPTQLVSFRNFDIPKFETSQNDSTLQIKTSYFTLTYLKNMPFKGSGLNSMKNLKVVLNDTLEVWYYNHPEAKNYNGSNISIEVDNNKKINKGLYSLDGFVSIDDSNSLILDEVGTVYKKDSNSIDIYLFMYNKDFGFALKDYFKLTGYPSMIPRYVLGNIWSKNTNYSDKDIYELINNFNSNDVPISVILLDKLWKKKDSGYTFNNELFSNPIEFSKNLHINNIKLGLNIDPSVDINNNDSFFNEAIKYINTVNNSIKFNPYDPRFIDIYLKLFIYPLEGIGVDFFWNDYKNIKDLNSLWIMNYYHFNDMEKTGKRGMILSRNPLIASHKFPICYSGESKVSWDNFKNLPFFSISSTNIGVCWWSHDIGGFSGGIEDADLFLRSIQLGVFSPILRFHSDDGKYYKKEPWKWEYKTKSIACEYLRLRHRFISYLYSEAYQYHRNGNVIFQPIYYLIPKLYDDVLYKNEYFFGSQLIVAPIINKKEPLINRTIHRFYLPGGVWYDYKTGKKFPGNKKYVAFYKDEDYPVFAKSGAIIPLSNKSNSNNTSNPTELEILIFPCQSNEYLLYEDDGISTQYKKGKYLITQIKFIYEKDKYEMVIKPIEGDSSVVPEYRDYKIRFKNLRNITNVSAFSNTINYLETNNYFDGNDFVVEINKVSPNNEIDLKCSGEDTEIDVVRIVNEDIASILMDLVIETDIKEKIDNILFSDLSIEKKRINLRKLSKFGLDKSFINLFLKLLEYIEQI
ncbi:MAG: glycoside hydrolase family 31 protein [bacterium]|nr:glycoside hydrolase family 31 protein [bacterium]